MTEKNLDIKIIDNLKLNNGDGYVEVIINPKVYPMSIVNSASYVFMDKAFVMLNGDPEKEIIVRLRPREKNMDLEELGRDLNDELLSYSVYNTQADKSQAVNDAIVQKALFTNQGEGASDDTNEINFKDESYEEDPLGIAKPFEESSKQE